MGTDYEALDLNELMAEAKRVNEEPGSNQGNADYLEKFVKLPERDGFVTLRILPKKKGVPLFCVTRVHTLYNPTTRQKKTYHCPKNLAKTDKGDRWQGDCIICRYYSELWQRSEGETGKAQEELQNQARAIKPVERYYYNVIVRSEKDKDGSVRKNVGPKIYSCGKTVHAKILRAIIGDKTAGEEGLGDVTHPKTGRDFRVVKKVVRGGGGAEYPNYDNSKFEDATPAGSPDELQVWLEKSHDLQALRAIKNPDELKHALRVHLGMVKEGDAGVDDELAEFRAATVTSAKTQPAKETFREELAVSSSSTPAAKTPAASSDDADEVMADSDFLKELADM